MQPTANDPQGSILPPPPPYSLPNQPYVYAAQPYPNPSQPYPQTTPQTSTIEIPIPTTTIIYAKDQTDEEDVLPSVLM